MDQDNLSIIQIINEIDTVESFIQKMSFDDFTDSKKTKRAIERSFEIISNAAKTISTETQDRYLTIPWKDISNLCYKLNHIYFDVDYNILWDTVKYDLPILRQTLRG